MDIYKIASRVKLIGALFALNAMLAFGFVPRAYADDDRAECQHRIQKAEAIGK